MAALVMRTLDWIDDAPVRVEARADSAASPEDVFAILADHEQWPQWFPSIRKVTVLGKAAGVGARRRVSIPGASVDEEFIAWEPGVRWSFTTALRPSSTRYISAIESLHSWIGLPRRSRDPDPRSPVCAL